MKPHLVVLSGAGMSAESGLKTFRDSGGLWEGYDVQDVATPEAWERNSELVLRFYNERRRALLHAEPNDGHRALADLENDFNVTVVTQNVDDLHERAGSTTVMHLHGELRKARSTKNPELIYDLQGWELKTGHTCELGAQLRPHIVWFGEEVPLMDKACEIVRTADYVAVIGTSLVVYPAAGLVNFIRQGVPRYLVDPVVPAHLAGMGFSSIEKPASKGVPELQRLLLKMRGTPTRAANSAAAANPK